MFYIKYTTTKNYFSEGFKTKNAAIKAAKKIGWLKNLTNPAKTKIEIIEKNQYDLNDLKESMKKSSYLNEKFEKDLIKAYELLSKKTKRSKNEK